MRHNLRGCLLVSEVPHHWKGVVFALLCSLVFHGEVLAATIYVSPSGSALNDGSSWTRSISDLAVAGQLAVAGDTILVSNGVYTSAGVSTDGDMSVIALQTGVTLRSVGGYEVTAIDGGGSNRCVYMQGSNTVLEGFTITGGRGGRGGGVRATDNGQISSCYIHGNVATNSSGGGLYMVGGRVEALRVESNSSYYGGGGLYMNDTGAGNTGLIYNSSFRWNHCSAGGGNGGGGVYARRVLIDRCVIAENESDNGNNEGGGIVVLYKESTLRNSLIVSNVSRRYGGGVYLMYETRMENCTVAWNKAYRAGGVYGNDRTNYCINSIIYHNTNTSGTASNYYNLTATSLLFTNCCTAPLANGAGNIASDPMMADGGWGLAGNSPCINAGLDMDWMTNALDLVGNPRLGNGTTVDIGAYEVVAKITPEGGPSAGGNTITVTNGASLGNGSDITNATVCGVAASVVSMGTDWVTLLLGSGPAGGVTGDIVIQSASIGTTTIPGAYTYNPQGQISSVSPSSCSTTGNCTVVISGTNLGDGSDVYAVSLCGVAVDTVVSQSSTQIVVIAAQADKGQVGDVVVKSTRYGTTTEADGFEYKKRVPLDFDGDGIADIGCYYPNEGDWFIYMSASSNLWTTIYGGGSGSAQISGFFDGDNICDYGTYYAVSGLWQIHYSSGGGTTNNFGFAGTEPVTGYFDDDQITDFGCYYAPNGGWFIFKSKTQSLWVNSFGFDGTVPVTGDFDGDGITDFGCYYPLDGSWIIYRSKTSDIWTTQFGYESTVPVTGDFDGDGICDFGCYDASGGYWYIFKSKTQELWVNTFGFAGTAPVVGDYDGDGVDDFGCYYPPIGGWYVYKSSQGLWTTQFGFEGTEAVQ